MDVPHNLEEIYSNIRSESVRYLEKHYGAIKVNPEDTNKYPVTLKVRVSVVEHELNLLVSLPFNFPDSFPKVKLDEQSFQKVYPLPHLSMSKTLCLFDEVAASPNPEQPIGVLEATIKKCKEILSKGILKQNLNDYSDEFETYWAENSRGFYLSIVKPSGTSKEVYLAPFKYQNWLEKGIFADKKSDAINWVHNLGGIINEEEITKVLYIPLKEPIKYPFPKNNKEIYNLLKENKCNLKSLTNFLSKNKRPTKVLFSMEDDSQYSWGVWEHSKPYKEIVSKYKGRRRIQTGIKGFRANKQHGLLEIIKEFPMVELNKYSVEDVSAIRLKTRGGDGKVENIENKVAIVGCGAVGSQIAQGIFDIGIQDLLLIDNDILSFENINRHLCGADHVGELKTEAVKSKLSKHYPTSNIDVYNENVLSVLMENPDALNSYDLIIVAISNTPTELRINELQRENIIKKPILNIWVEPYLAGGHAIWNEPNNSVPLNILFNNEGLYKYQILKDGNVYSKRELGCYTSYVPYGVLELKKFIVEVMFFIQQQLVYEDNKSRIFTWIGNLTEQRKKKRLLATKWVGATDFSSRIQEIE
ncbi:ThiF family adenylyltransferase [Evansella halocellulosilytica]|uniref:ThiF family adenylyltransferase n=1 Tax=Evansella halocellulosilytica TaxID=2011013 RepID=UPI000BB997EF|nr:ThiF family adenylyltransferase [Evansella halocellulosilytica]